MSLYCITLVEADKTTLTSGSELMDIHINFTQVILKAQFNKVLAFYSTLQLMRLKAPFPGTGGVIQIMHMRGNHWIMVFAVRCSGKNVNELDSILFS